jgi:hypothetical protein
MQFFIKEAYSIPQKNILSDILETMLTELDCTSCKTGIAFRGWKESKLSQKSFEL